MRSKSILPFFVLIILFAFSSAPTQLTGDAGRPRQFVGEQRSDPIQPENRGQLYEYENDNNLQIPNPPVENPSNPGKVASPLELQPSEDYTIVEPKVYIGITHQYIGDLVVMVIPPWSEEGSDVVVFHNREGGSGDNIYQWFDMNGKPEMGAWIGHKPVGTWYLYVQDCQRHYTTPSSGYIDTWILQFNGNYPPTQPKVDIKPDGPTAEDTLTASAVSTDKDGDTITYYYQWFKNGEEEGQLTSSTVPPSETQNGDTWACGAVAYDGVFASDPGFDQVVIGNAAPTAPGISIQPLAPETGDALILSVNVESTDDSGFVSYLMDWYRNGNFIEELVNMSSVNSSMTAKGEVWECVVTPVDNLGAHGPSASANVTIANSPPSQVEVFYPRTTSDNKPEVQWWGGDDPNDDILSYYVEVKNQSGPVFDDFVEVGEEWVFPERVGYGPYNIEITPTDGEDEGKSKVFDMTIENDANLPPGPVESILPATTSDPEPMVFWTPATDPEGKNVTYKIRVGTGHGKDDIFSFVDVGQENYYQIITSLPWGKYFVQIIALDGHSNSKVVEQEMTVNEIHNSPPYPPLEIKANSGPLPGSVEGTVRSLSWSEGSDHEDQGLSYVAMIGTGYASDDILKVETGKNLSAQVNITPEPGRYYVTVRCYDALDAWGEFGLPLEVKPPNRAPEPPDMCGPTQTTELQPLLYWFGAWDPDGDEVGYYVTISSSGSRVVYVNNHYNQGTEFRPDLELPQGRYDVKVVATDGELQSPALEWTVTINPGANSPPSAPGQVYPTRTQNPSPELIWGPSTDRDGDGDGIEYFLALGSGPGKRDIMDWRTAGDRCRYTIPVTLAKESYHVTIYASDGVNKGPPTGCELEVVAMNNPPQPVSNITPGETPESSPTMSWRPSLDPEGDDVSYYISIGSETDSNDVLDVRSTSKPTYSVEEELGQGTYFIKLWSTDGLDNSSITVHTLEIGPGANTPPPRPCRVSPSETSDPDPKISWMPVTDPDGDEVEYFIGLGTAEVTLDVINWTRTGQSSYQVPLLLSDGAYYIHLRSYDGTDLSNTGIFAITVDGQANDPPVFLKDPKPMYSINRTVTIPMPETKDPEGAPVWFEVMITDTGGKSVMSWTRENGPSFETPALENGNYIVYITANDGNSYSGIVQFELTVEYVPPVYDLEISSEIFDQEELIIKPKGSTTFSFIVKNVGNVMNWVNISAKSDLDMEIEISWGNRTSPENNILPLDPGSEMEVNFTLITTGNKGQGTLRIGFSSLNQSSLTINKTVALNIEDNTEQGKKDEGKGQELLPDLWLYAIILAIIVLIVVGLVVRRSGPGAGEEKKAEALRPDIMLSPKAKRTTKTNKKEKVSKKERKVEYVSAEIVYQPDVADEEQERRKRNGKG